MKKLRNMFFRLGRINGPEVWKSNAQSICNEILRIIRKSYNNMYAKTTANEEIECIVSFWVSIYNSRDM